MSEQALIVAAWLRSLPQIQNVIPVSISIKGTVYHGAQYDSVGTYESGMHAVQSGAHKAGEEYTTTRIYLLGKLPACYVRSSHIAFRLPNDSRDWFISAYMPAENLKPENASFHPFGISFQLSCWDMQGSAVDSHELRPYERIPVALRPAETV